MIAEMIGFIVVIGVCCIPAGIIYLMDRKEQTK